MFGTLTLSSHLNTVVSLLTDHSWTFKSLNKNVPPFFYLNCSVSFRCTSTRNITDTAFHYKDSRNMNYQIVWSDLCLLIKRKCWCFTGLMCSSNIQLFTSDKQTTNKMKQLFDHCSDIYKKCNMLHVSPVSLIQEAEHLSYSPVHLFYIRKWWTYWWYKAGHAHNIYCSYTKDLWPLNINQVSHSNQAKL